MAYSYEPMESLIPNTTMRKRLYDGVLRTYLIKPNAGYVMHDKGFDVPEMDEETLEETGVTLLGYRSSEASIGYNDPSLIFDENGVLVGLASIQMQDNDGNTVTAYTSRQFFCKLADDVPADQIFGGGNIDHEII